MTYKISTKIPDRHKYYPVRSSNSLTKLRKWKEWGEKKYPEQKLVIIDDSYDKLKGKEKDYWKMRYKQDLEHKYKVYATY